MSNCYLPKIKKITRYRQSIMIQNQEQIQRNVLDYRYHVQQDSILNKKKLVYLALILEEKNLHQVTEQELESTLKYHIHLPLGVPKLKMQKVQQVVIGSTS